MKTIKLLPVLMVLSIVAIVAFQFYWLKQAYEREERTLEMRTNITFRDAVRSVQISKLKFDRGDTARTASVVVQQNKDSDDNKMGSPPQKIEGMVDAVMNKVRDSSSKAINFDSLFQKFPGRRDRRERMLQFLFDIDSLQDSVRIVELDSAYQKHLDDQNLDVNFTIDRVATRETKQPVFNEVTLGFRNPVTYRLQVHNKNAFIFKRIYIPILFSIFLVAFTALSFSLLYRNLLLQNRLSDIKNDFISNITHELKTPIATISVAIEALRNFNANLDARRTKEYLDISSNELQRLSLLVDKVLKLSMFEKKEIDLQYEVLDMKNLVNEVTSSLRLQFEKYGAEVHVNSKGDTTLEGDRLHLVSVIFNLLDNAIKYSDAAPKIGINMTGNEEKVDLVIEDSGIGIPDEYKRRIFEKFFRVPTGNVHNAKGYGLGLSYVAHIIEKHNGTINVESIPGDGSKFVISLPKHKS
ncbi:MAG TPA: HAMP domain-containing sensor histidine kinase [Flavisolibacter sp.]|nr:HAMP domain-containing sensor histidine kinase [Flavisolibacter sp.]